MLKYKILITVSIVFLLNTAKGLAVNIEKDSILAHNTSIAFSPQCDACGCALNSVSGIDDLASMKFIGVKYIYQHYKVKSSLFSPEPDVNQYYHSTQLQVKYSFAKKWVVSAILPYQINNKDNSKQSIEKGFGDMLFTVGYYVLNSKNNKKELMHYLLLNTGLKLPTGKFDSKNSNAINSGFQIGSGSWDYFSSVNYQIVIRHFAGLISTDYLIKKSNPDHYKLGNQWSAGVSGYYVFKTHHSTIYPKLGIYYENYNKNEENGVLVPGSEGELVLVKTGLNFDYKAFTVSAEYNFPYINNLSKNNIILLNRSGLNLYYKF